MNCAGQDLRIQFLSGNSNRGSYTMAPTGDTEQVDVLIAGAGPAASATAITLSDSGLGVLMLERKMEIGSPVICADMVNMSFPEIDSLQSDPRIKIRSLDSLSIGPYSGTGAFTMVPSYGEGDAFNSVVERDRLDKELASLALLNGVRLQIRAELTGFREIDGSIVSTYRKGGRQRNVRSSTLVLATGMEDCNGREPSDCFNYQYARRIGGGMMKNEIGFGHGGAIRFSISRSPGEYNSLLTAPFKDGGHEVQVGEKDLILTGSISRSFHGQFDAGRGNVIHAGSFSGLHDPFFRTGFREAFLSGRYAAESILESSGNNASLVYRTKIEENVLNGMDYGRKLGKLLSSASDEKMTQFFKYLSGFEFAEISAMEIFKKTGLKDSELEEML